MFEKQTREQQREAGNAQPSNLSPGLRTTVCHVLKMILPSEERIFRRNH